jgi:hypothetical protein
MPLSRLIADVRSNRRQFRIFVNRERRYAARHRVSLRERVGALRYGFLAEHLRLYGVTAKVASADYLSDWQRGMRSSLIDSPFTDVLRNKLIFDRMIRPIAEKHLPPLIGYLLRGGEEMLVGDSGDRSDAWPVIAREAGREAGIIFKPEDGQGGHGLLTLRRIGEDTWLINGKPGDEAKAREAVIADTAQVVQGVVSNHPEIDTIWPGALATARVMVMHDPISGEPFIARAVQRFGSSASGIADNMSSGGVAALIDVETGKMGRCAALTGISVTWSTSHPETGEEITGRVLPGWHAAVEELLQISRKLPFLPYVGWDVAITSQGMMIIEGNHCPETRVVQLDQPLLADPRVRRFYAHHGVL